MSSPSQGVDDVGVLLKHTPDWVRAECRAGRLPHHKIGRIYVFTEADIAEILAATAVPARVSDRDERPARRRRGRLTYTRVGNERKDERA